MRLKSRSSGLIGLFLLLILPVSLWAIQNLKLDPRKKAAETNQVSPNTFSQPTNFVVENEVIIKFKSDSLRLKSTASSLNLNKTAASLNSFESSSLPTAITKINNQYPVTSLEKIFKQENPTISLKTANKKLQGTYKITFDKNIPVENVINDLKNNPEVEYAEPNIILHTVYVPQDPRYTEQWAHQYTQAESGWDIEKGKPDTIIAVLDTGVDYNHEDLKDSMLADCTNGCPPGTGYDFVSAGGNCTDPDCNIPDNDPSDYFGHGTHCAGIIAATNNDKGVIGICPGCKIMPIRAGYASGGGGSLETTDIAQGIIYAADNGAKVISMSLGGGDSQTMKNAIDYAYGKGVVLVAAAGNSGSNLPSYPAAYDNVISVSSTGPTDQLANYSNYGTWVDIAAPGGDSSAGKQILSTVPKIGVLADPSGYMELQGTSMATPYAAGAIGLYLSKFPDTLNTRIKNILRQGVDSGFNWTNYAGTGRINIQKLLQVDPSFDIGITSPKQGQILSGNIDLIGTASVSNFASYTLSFGLGNYPSQFTIFKTSDTPVINGTLANNFDTIQMNEGINVIKLEVKKADNTVAEYRLAININNIKITNPQNNDILNPKMVLQITGTTTFPLTDNYYFEYAKGKENLWSSDGIRINHTGNNLASWDMVNSNLSGYYKLRMVIDRGSYKKYIEVIDLFFDPTLKIGWPQRILAESYDDPSFPFSLENIQQFYISPLLLTNTSDYSTISVLSKNNFEAFLKSSPQALTYYWTGMMEPVVGDLDKDGNKEIIVYTGGNPPKVQIYSKTGVLLKQINVGTVSANGVPGGNLFPPVASDINNDGFDEILVINPFPNTLTESRPARIYAYSHTGELLWSTEISQDFQYSIAVGDLNLDGKKEIIVKGSNKYQPELTVLNNTGQIFKHWSLNLPSTFRMGIPQSTPTLGNFDDNPDLEIVIAGCDSQDVSKGNVSIYKSDGTPLPGWPISLETGILVSPSIGDINNDGKNELVVGTLNQKYYGAPNQGGLYVFDRNGNLLPGWPQKVGEDIFSYPALADLDGDGKLEIAFSTNHREIYLYKYTGQNYNANHFYTCGYDNYSPIIGDINGDSKLELLNTADAYGCSQKLNAFDIASGTIINTFPKVMDLGSYVSPTLFDLEADNKIDILGTSSWDQDNVTGGWKFRSSVYIWTTNGFYNSSFLPWPKFSHDNDNTGNFKLTNECPQKSNGNTDCDSSALINEVDLSILLSMWTPVTGIMGGSGENQADLNGDGFVNDNDLQILLSNWKTK